MRPWIKNHPNINVITDSAEKMCPHCGSTSIELAEGGTYNTQHYKYPVYKCTKCGAIFRSKDRVSNKQNCTSI